MKHKKENCNAGHQIIAGACGLMCGNCLACKCGECTTGQIDGKRVNAISMEQQARMMTTCPKCGAGKSAGEHSQIVCWGECWRGEGGLKFTQLETEQWLKENAMAGAFAEVNR